MLAGIGPVTCWSSSRMRGLPGEAEAQALDVAPPAPDAVALLMYTSGTTGMPKGVMLTQATSPPARRRSARSTGSPRDRVLAALPLYHINAFAVPARAARARRQPGDAAGIFGRALLGAGARRMHLDQRGADDGLLPARRRTPPAEALRASASAARPRRRCRPSTIAPSSRGSASASSRRWASPRPRRPPSATRWPPGARKVGSVGRPPAARHASSTPAAELPDGEHRRDPGPRAERDAGLLQERGSDARGFTPDGWLRTGDLGHRDADGFFFVTGRIKELIIKGGENIAPREIDEALLQHPAVLDAAAVGVPDRHYGRRSACIVLREGAPAPKRSCARTASATLGRYKAPGHIRFVERAAAGAFGEGAAAQVVAVV